MPMPISLMEFFGIVLFNMMFVAIFGYFVLHLDGDPDSCLASTENDHNFMYALKKGFGVKEDDSKESNMDNLPNGKVSENAYIDVGVRFRLVFTILFLGHLVQLIGAFFLISCNPRTARKIYGIVPFVTCIIIIVGNLYAFYARFVHSGRVCSGDYIEKSERSKTYLIA